MEEKISNDEIKLETHTDLVDTESEINETEEVIKNSNLENNLESENSLENSSSNSEDSFEGVPNCLSLTVKEDYKLSIVKNVFLKSIRSSLKIAFSVLTLNLLKLFL